VVIENCAIATMDGRQHDSGAEHRSGHIAMSGGRITAVVEHGELRTVDMTAARREVRAARRRITAR